MPLPRLQQGCTRTVRAVRGPRRRPPVRMARSRWEWSAMLQGCTGTNALLHGARGWPSLQRPRLPQGFCGPAETCLQGAHNLSGKGLKLSQRSPKRARKRGSGSSAPAKRRRRSAAPESRPPAPPALPASAAERLQLLMGGHDYLGRDRLASASASVLTDLLPLRAGAQPVAGSLMPPHVGMPRSMGAGYPPGLTPSWRSWQRDIARDLVELQGSPTRTRLRRWAEA